MTMNAKTNHEQWPFSHAVVAEPNYRDVLPAPRW